MKQMLRTMTPAQVDTMIQTASQPRLTTNMPKNHSRGKDKKKISDSALPGKTTRPLNSWIAFRSYYSTAFPKFQQKNISGFLKVMWQTDPFKAKWSILAKSYSLIRDSQGKDNTPLDEFLTITGPLIGIITPEHYLEAMGWEVVMNGGGEVRVRQYVVKIDERLLISNLSVNDLIRHCYRVGYFTGNTNGVLSSDGEVVMTMATSSVTASQSSVVHHSQGFHSEMAGTADGDSLEKEANDMKGKGVATNPPDNSVLTSDGSEITEEATQMYDNHGNMVTSDDQPTTAGGGSLFGPTSNSYNTTLIPNNVGPEALAGTNGDGGNIQMPTATLVDLNPASGLSAENFHLASEYPFNAEFDPNAPTTFVFDPFAGNQFDVFNVSDTTWNDMIDFDAPQ